MENTIQIEKHLSKVEKYRMLHRQIKALLQGESNLIAKLANLAAALKYGFDFFWVGFYLLEDNQLILGPFQGSVACYRIEPGKGVCGTAFQKGESIIVADVNQFEGHIACSSDSKSEIVVPLKVGENLIGVLDIDSDEFNHFDSTDQLYLEKILQSLADTIHD